MKTGEQSVAAFCSQLAAGTPAPGGGAAAAVTGALGAALVSMAAGLTVGRPKFADVHDEMVDLQQAGVREYQALLALADDDQEAFTQVMAAFGMPKGTPERAEAVQAGYRVATAAPLRMMQHCISVMRGALAAAQRGNPNAMPDAYVGYLAAAAAFEGGLWNVATNLGSIRDEAFKQETLATVHRLRAERAEVAEAFQALVPDPVAKFLNE